MYIYKGMDTSRFATCLTTLNIKNLYIVVSLTITHVELSAYWKDTDKSVTFLTTGNNFSSLAWTRWTNATAGHIRYSLSILLHTIRMKRTQKKTRKGQKKERKQRRGRKLLTKTCKQAVYRNSIQGVGVGDWKISKVNDFSSDLSTVRQWLSSQPAAATFAAHSLTLLLCLLFFIFVSLATNWLKLWRSTVILLAQWTTCSFIKVMTMERTYVFHKMRGISWVAEKLSAPQKVHCSSELVNRGLIFKDKKTFNKTDDVVTT